MKLSLTQRALAVASAVLMTTGIAGLGAAPASATATPGTYIATGHDLDWHCDPNGGNDTNSCDELSILIHKATTATNPRILALTSTSVSGAESLDAALATMSGITYDVIDVVNDLSSYTAANFSNYDVIITESVYGNNDNGPLDDFVTNVNTRSANLIAYYNTGGGIIQLANGGTDSSNVWAMDYYLALGFHAASVDQSDPNAPTTLGATWGLTDAMSTCCATHNAFTSIPTTMDVLEHDGNNLPLTVTYYNKVMPSTGIGGNTQTVDMNVNVAPGASVNGANVTVSAAWLKADTAWDVKLDGAATTCDSTQTANTNIYGALNCTFTLGSLTAGTHTVVLTGIAEDGSVVTKTATFVVDANGNLVSWTYSRDAAPVLASTGVDSNSISSMLLAAGFLAAAGAAFVASARRRKVTK